MKPPKLVVLKGGASSEASTSETADELAAALVKLLEHARAQRRSAAFAVLPRATVARIMEVAEELYRRAEDEAHDG